MDVAVPVEHREKIKEKQNHWQILGYFQWAEKAEASCSIARHEYVQCT